MITMPVRAAYDPSTCNPLRWRVTLRPEGADFWDLELASMVSTPEIEAGLVVSETCRKLLQAATGAPVDPYDVLQVLDLMVANEDSDIIRAVVVDLLVWSVERAQDVVELDDVQWTQEVFRFAPAIPLRYDDLQILLRWSRALTNDLWEQLILDGLTTGAMVALAARALGYLCTTPDGALDSLLDDFENEMDEAYGGARRCDAHLRSRC